MRVRLFAGLTAMIFMAGMWLSLPVSAQRGRGAPQPNRGAPQPNLEQQEASALVQYVQDVVAGNAVPPDAPLTWQSFYVKSQGNQVYVPFTVMLEPGKLTAKQVGIYYSVVPKGPQIATFAVKPQEEENTVSVEGEILNTAASATADVKLTVTAMDNAGKVLGTQAGAVAGVAAGQRAPFKILMKSPRNTTRYNVVVEGANAGFRDVSFTDLPGAPSGQPVRISRAFVVAPGEYDMYVAVRERPERDQKTAPKVALLKESVSIPDLNSKLTVSSVFFAEKIDQLSAPLNRDQQLRQPYTLGTMAITPATSTTLAKSGELSVIFFVYNTGVDGAKKPNLEIEYNFHQKTAEGEKFFNKTNPQQFNAETLPPQFDLAQGHQIVGGQTIPLASFQPGDYRLEIKVSDKISGQSLTRNVPFAVAAS